ncbi:MAG: hypothetical protein AAB596_02290 [Patescibacteria group bacterium]
MSNQSITGSTLRVMEVKLNGACEVMLAKINFKGVEYSIEKVRSVKAPEGAIFLLAKVMAGEPEGEKVLWQFKDEEFTGFAYLEEAGGIPVICLVSYAKKLKRIIPLEDLSSLRRVKVAGEMQVITSRNIAEVIKLKALAAKKLKLEPEFTEAEKAISRVLLDREKEKEEQKRKDRIKEKEERIQRILSRPQVFGYDQSGFKKYGHPVMGDEWCSLPEGTFVVLVESYNNETNECGELIEAFAVSKKNGKPEKKNASNVQKEPVCPRTNKLTAPEAIRIAFFEIEGRLEQIAVYKDIEDVRMARQSGLNGGALVATDNPDEQGRYQIFAVGCKEIETKGHFIPLA